MSDARKTHRRPTEHVEPVQAHLGEKLKEFYGAILSEPVPDRLTSLLDELEKQERAALAAQAKGGHE